MFDVSDNKVRDHCHVAGMYKGAAHWSCNVNFKMTKKVLVIFHNLELTWYLKNWVSLMWK